MPSFYTRKGDNGTTGLLGPGRVPKYELRMETLGAIDEATAHLGMARAICSAPGLAEIILQVQRDLYQLMAEVAAPPESAAQFRKIDSARVEWLEEQTDTLTSRVNMPREFIVPGDSVSSAVLDTARAVVRRAERRVTELHARGEIENNDLLRYLNRLSSLCFVMELWENQAAGRDRPTLARHEA